MVNGNFQLIFWTFTNPIWLLMINLPKISLQIVPDQIALYLVSDCSSRYLHDWYALTIPLEKSGFNLILVLQEFIPIMLK